MQSIQKRKSNPLTSFLFPRLDSTPTIYPLYFFLVMVNILFDAMAILQYIISEYVVLHQWGNYVLFWVCIAGLAGFGVVALVGCFVGGWMPIWTYWLMGLEAITILYVRGLNLCMRDVGICNNQIPYKIAYISIFIIFALVILILKSSSYFPFQSITHIFSTRQKHLTSSLFLYRFILGLALYHNILSSREQQIRVIVIISFALFWKSRQSGYLHLKARAIWNVYYWWVAWLGVCLFVSEYMGLIGDSVAVAIYGKPIGFMEMTIYLWMLTFPFALAIPLSTSKITPESWHKLLVTPFRNSLSPSPSSAGRLETSTHNLLKNYQKQQIFIMCNQMYHQIGTIKKSEMKFKQPEYKKLCCLIEMHNSQCSSLDCVLAQLYTCQLRDPKHNSQKYKEQQKQQGKIDQFWEQKRFGKVLKLGLEYVRECLESLKEKYPNDVEVQLEIAYFYLVALKNKQKGMILYNELNTQTNKKVAKQSEPDHEPSENEQDESSSKKAKSEQKQISKAPNDPSFAQKYAINYLKNKIDSMFTGEQKQIQNNVDNQISQFRQKIEISVTLLAQFWSLLADPKCNLKKMYELTNVLFPLKVNLEEEWERIKLFKNIQSFAIYAKYLVRMFNDKDKGFKILQEAKRIQYQLKNKDEIQLDDKGGEIIEQNGIIFMEYDGKNSGMMYQMNANAQKIFCYSKSELINKKVNQIMPRIYAMEHDKILQNYLQTNYSTMVNKERLVWGKSKQGFIFPMNILIKPILSYYSQTSNSEVYANIKKQPYLRQVIGIILDKDEMVEQYTSSALRVFEKLAQRHKNKNKTRSKPSSDMNSSSYKKQHKNSSQNQQNLHIAQLIPNFAQIKHKILVEYEQFEYKMERVIKLSRPSRNSSNMSSKQCINFNFNSSEKQKIEKSKKLHGDHIEEHQEVVEKCVYNIQINEINIKITGKIGYCVKMTKIGSSQYVYENNKENGKEGLKRPEGIELNGNEKAKGKFLVEKKDNYLGVNIFGKKQSQKKDKDSDNLDLQLVTKSNSSEIHEQKQNNRVKFNVTQNSNTFQKRKFIFSYDFIQKQRIFQNSLKQLQKQQNQYASENQQSHPLNPQSRSPAHSLPLKQKSRKALPQKSPYSLPSPYSTQQMKYIAGYTRSPQILQRFRNETLSNFKAQLKISQQQHEQQKIDYSIGIKTKRLHESAIRQMRQQQSYSPSCPSPNSPNYTPEHPSQQSHHPTSQLHPSELTQILSNKKSSKPITILRVLTMGILVVPVVCSIVQYGIVKQWKLDMFAKMEDGRLGGEIVAEMYGIGFGVLVGVGLGQGQGANQTQGLGSGLGNIAVDQINQMVNRYQFRGESLLEYGDGSKDTYYLGFAMNKFISEANSLKMAAENENFSVFDPTVYFIQKNAINGLSIALANQQELIWNQYKQILQKISNSCVVFLGIVSGVCGVLIIAINIGLRIVIRKKSEILGIFFQIPRISCSLIQKQCQLFILRLTSQNQDQQIQFIQHQQDQFSDPSKPQKTQKKRTIVGQQNTTISFTIISILFVIILLAFQLYYQSIDLIRKNDFLKIGQTARVFYDIEYQMFQLPYFMESYTIGKAMNQSNGIGTNGTLSLGSDMQILGSTDFQEVFEEIDKILEKRLPLARASFFDILQILDDKFDKEAIHIFYQSLCITNEYCEQTTQSPQQRQGVNAVLSRYTQIVKSRYSFLYPILFHSLPSSSPSPSLVANSSATLPPSSLLSSYSLYQNNLKQHWRVLTSLISEAINRYILSLESVNLYILISICVVYMVVFVIVWMRYYYQLEEKLKATQYILTFIPIDQINKNWRIVQYIKREIGLRK